MKLFVLIISLLFSLPSFAEDSAYNCKDNEKKILKVLKRFPYCDHDEECRYFDYGYPWQKDACVKAIVSTKEENNTLRYLKAIEEYNQNCVYNDKKKNRKFLKIQQSLKEKECKESPRLFCLKGVCRNQFYPMFFDDAGSIR